MRQKANRGGMLHQIGLGSGFVDMTPKALATGAKIHQWNHINQKASAHHRKLEKWGKMFPNNISDRA